MKCPHCRVEIHPAFKTEAVNQAQWLGWEGQARTGWQITYMECPACKKAILNLHKQVSIKQQVDAWPIYPRNATGRAEAPPEVPIDLADDFNEACAVLSASPKASAALSRRCLQHLLRLHGFTQHDLAKQIDAILASKSLPAALADNLDAIRNIGNFAAHPMKDSSSGQILPVEPHEAEWNLDVLDGLFEYFYVLPARDKARVAALNAKLAAAGKPPMKH